MTPTTTLRPLLILIGLFLFACLAVEGTVRVMQETGNLTDETRLQDDLLRRHPKYLYTLNPNVQTNFKYRRKHMDVPVDINAFGFRDVRMKKEKAPGVFRIAALGDSVTFGWEVLEQDSYPRQLERQLNNGATKQTFEVLNFGVPGYTSYSGKQILQDVVLDFHPDLLIVGYGFNDWKYRIHGVSDEQALLNIDLERRKNIYADALLDTRGWLRKVRTFAVVDDRLHDRILKSALPEDYGLYTHKVNLPEYDANIRQIVATCEAHHLPVVLMNTNFLNDYTAQTLDTISREQNVPLLDARELLEDRAATQSDLEVQTATWLGLDRMQPSFHPSTNGEVPLTFRFYVPPSMQELAAKQGLYVFGNHPKLGAWTAGALPLNDRGEEGDEVAGDGVWSTEVFVDEKTPDLTLEYTVLPYGPDNKRPDGQYPVADFRSFLFFYHVPWREIRAHGGFRSPVHVMGYTNISPWLLAGKDFVHPNAAGYRIMTQALTDLLQKPIELMQMALHKKKSIHAPHAAGHAKGHF